MFNLTFPVNIRILFALSMLANVPAATTGRAGRITNYAKPIIREALESAPRVDSISLKGWQLVWGPAVVVKRGLGYISFSHVASNAMCVFKDSTSTNYVIAIQATNPYCTYDWLVENGAITKTVPWKNIVNHPELDSDIQISKGSFTGLSILLNDLIDNTVADQETTIVQYLKNITHALPAGKKINVIISAHSLGAALGAALNLYLHDTKNTWDPDALTTQYFLSTAAPSTGNKAFAAYYDSKMGANTIRIWNTLDIVPMVWVPSLFDVFKLPGTYSIPGVSVDAPPIYCANLTTKCDTATKFESMSTPKLIHNVLHELDGVQKYQYTPVGGAGYCFTGTPHGRYINVSHTGKLPYAWFLEEIAQQHMTAYMMTFNILPINTYVRALIQKDTLSIVNNPCFNVNHHINKKPHFNFYDIFEALYQNSWGW